MRVFVSVVCIQIATAVRRVVVYFARSVYEGSGIH